MKRTFQSLLATLFLLSLPVRSVAQDFPPTPLPDSMQTDSLSAGSLDVTTHTIPTESRLSFEGRGFFNSPTGTLFKSVVIPGWGQWSNGKKQKAAIYLGIETYFITKAMIWRSRTSDRYQLWNTSCDAEGGCDQGLFNSFDSARDRRNYFYWLLGTTVFISMFDAYSDRYLITLEQTRNKGDDYWGGQSSQASASEWRLLATVKF